MIILGLTVFPLSDFFAQSNEVAPLSTAEATQLLRDKVPLLVRLPSDRRKIEYYLQQQRENPINKEVYQRRMDELIRERNRNNGMLVDSLSAIYRLQPLLFFYDYSSTILRTGRGKGIFLDRSFEAQPNIAIPDRYLVLHVGDRIGSGQSLAGIQLLDRNYQPLNRAIPSFSKRNGLGSLWRSLGDREVADRKDVRQMIRRFQKKLVRYLNE